MSPQEVLAALNELLEAERAGAWVARQSASEAGDEAMKALLLDIQQDEVRWCGMLMRAVRTLEGEPSSAVGDFRRKALAIADLHERLIFLNKGQAWVVRRLERLIPEVGHAEVKAELEAMLAAHRHNIARAEAF